MARVAQYFAIEAQHDDVPIDQSLAKLQDLERNVRLPGVDSLADEMYTLLMEPLHIDAARVKRLVIVADQPLHDLPFAILRDQRCREYLIERFELLRVASASVYAQTKSPGGGMSNRNESRAGNAQGFRRCLSRCRCPQCRGDVLGHRR